VNPDPNWGRVVAELLQGGVARADPPPRLQGHSQGYQGTERPPHGQCRGESLLKTLLHEIDVWYLCIVGEDFWSPCLIYTCQMVYGFSIIRSYENR
jgi:hypothetical protein